MKRCIIIPAFIIGKLRDAVEIQDSDYIICADGGWQAAAAEGIQPSLLIGDFDSLKGALPEGVETIRYPSEKDDTDTMICVKYAVENGFDEICIAGGIGGRLDHTLSNLQSMAWAVDCWKHSPSGGKKAGTEGGLAAGKRISMADSQNHVTLISEGSLELYGQPGSLVSLISYSNEASGITTEGMKYPLSGAVLKNSFPLGISNEFTGYTAKVTVGDGMLLVIQTHD